MDFPLRKFANALIADAEPVDAPAMKAVDPVLRVFKRYYGGLWVGGAVHISADGIVFSPNAINRAFHENPTDLRIAADDIRSVHREFGWVSGIVVVRHHGGEFRFRCFGAKSLAAAMSGFFQAPRRPG